MHVGRVVVDKTIQYLLQGIMMTFRKIARFSNNNLGE